MNFTSDEIIQEMNSISEKVKKGLESLDDEALKRRVTVQLIAHGVLFGKGLSELSESAKAGILHIVEDMVERVKFEMFN